jgi:DNA-directed RNA polymerase subunit L
MYNMLDVPSFDIVERARDDKIVTWHVKKCDVALMVALRRIIMSKVRTVGFAFDPYDPAMQDIQVLVNTGCFHDEWLAHRMSLIPIHFDRAETADFDPDRYVFEVKKTCANGKSQDVTSADIVVIKDGVRDDALAARLFPPDPITKDHVILSRLRWFDGASYAAVKETIHLRCKARLGDGGQHARWSPVSRCTYNYVRCDDDADERCYIKDKFGKPCEYMFQLESECGLTCIDIVQSALLVLIQQLDTMRVRSTGIDGEGFTTLQLERGDKTLAGFVQAMLYEMFVRDGKQRLSFIGYAAGHPLEDGVVFKVRADGAPAQVFEECVAELRKWVARVADAFQEIL